MNQGPVLIVALKEHIARDWYQRTFPGLHWNFFRYITDSQQLRGLARFSTLYVHPSASNKRGVYDIICDARNYRQMVIEYIPDER